MSYPVLSLRVFALAFLVCLSGCGVLDWADEHMPVIGQRCENWQCFTEGGRQQSEINHQEIIHANQTSSAPAAMTAPTPGGAAAPTSVSAPATPPASTNASLPSEPMPEEGAYKYMPRGPSAPGTTPFDGAIQPIE